MQLKLGHKNLILLLNSDIPVEPVMHGIHRLAVANMDKHFTVVTGGELKHLSSLLEVIEVIHAPKENYQITDAGGSTVDGNMPHMNKLIDDLEGKNFDSLIQVGALEWGRWLPVSLEPVKPQVVRVSGPATSLETHRRICNAFGLDEATDFVNPDLVYVDFSSLSYEVQELFAYDNLASYCHWLHLAREPEIAQLRGKSKCAIITANLERFLAWSARGEKAILIDANGQGLENVLFLQNQFCLKINSEKVDAAKLFNALSLWQRNRLNEFGLIQLSNNIEFFQVVKLGKVSTCQSTKDLNQEYGIIQDITHIFKVAIESPEDVSKAEIETYFSSRSIDRFALLNALYSIRYIGQNIIEAIEMNERVFAAFANDYYKISLAHEIVEILCSGEEEYSGQGGLRERMITYLGFLETIEEFVDNRIVTYRKQGE